MPFLRVDLRERAAEETGAAGDHDLHLVTMRVLDVRNAENGDSTATQPETDRPRGDGHIVPGMKPGDLT